MEPFDGDLVHFVGNRVIPVSSQAVDADPDQEMSSDLLCCAEKLVDVTLASYDGFWVTRSDQAARTSAVGTTSIPSANFTPDITFGN
ncbi:hypothetical protein ACVWY5_000185 [Bradyrhizobium sp. USDA 3256]